MISKTLLFGLLLLGSVQASAQVITDGPRATAARDSLLQAATNFRLGIESQTSRFNIRAGRAGKRRQRIRGYVVGFSRRPVWEIKRLHRFNGTTEELFTAYTDGVTSMKQRTVDGELTYLWLHYITGKTASAATPSPLTIGYGEYLPNGHLRWKQAQYILPTTIK
ncbi:hypothetical protein [Hymenobacter lapidiphilus]|uniref:Nuclear transport factor 2 family protein n=1 Tax=Hymenobacter lapidiphilus TaxID=2608003 RepID=A0A7Y7PPG6_9BACT|nr:hypothetical protein [Hymenobacter lapidiphilus]NVO31520.1 hypothetical protein [Hymenobacter lapidiphilus]